MYVYKKYDSETMPKSKKKGNKSKLRKLQRLAELEEEKKRSLVIKTANYVEDGAVRDTLAEFGAFKKFNRNGLDVLLEFSSGSTMDDDTRMITLDVLKTNMKQMYERSGWGWSDKKKWKEHTDPDARFLVARNIAGEVIGFTHFRFLQEKKHAVLYIFELQVAANGRRCGLGKHMMQICELMARKNAMKFVMLTVFKNNLSAIQFYRSKMKYDVDETSPSMCGVDDQPYEILSKCIDPSLKNRNTAPGRHQTVRNKLMDGNIDVPRKPLGDIYNQ